MELDLLLDIGNTRSKWLITKSIIEPTLTIEQSGVIDNEFLLDQLQEPFSNSNIEIKNIYCTCVGKLDYLNIWQGHFPKANLYQLTGDSVIPDFENGYQRPSELGTDRLAGMLGAKQLFPGKNTIVVASGTATTIDFLHQGTQFIGGWIIPGLDLMLKSLGKSTANLPTLEASHLPTQPTVSSGVPSIPFGTTTREAIEMGAILASVGAIQQVIQQLNHVDLILITGGNAPLLESYLRSNMKKINFIQEPNLILIGINAWRFYLKGARL